MPDRLQAAGRIVRQVIRDLLRDPESGGPPAAAGFRSVDLRRADLRGSDLAGVYPGGAVYDPQTRRPWGFRPQARRPEGRGRSRPGGRAGRFR